mgnify:CR=1 FL=1
MSSKPDPQHDKLLAAVREAFEADGDQLMVPAYYAWMGAIGSALTAGDVAAGIA